MARKKVVAPVTPRIVQAHPGQRLFWYVLLFCAFLLTAWFSYDYGRTHAPGNAEAPVAQSRESKQRITGLEQERDTLKQQVVELEQRIEQANQVVGAAQTRIQALQQAQSSPREVPAPEPAASVPEPGDNTLKLANVHIEPTESANVFRIGFSVMHVGASTERVTGTIWIAVNGFSARKPKRLSFKTLSADRRLYVKMGFDLQQDVTEDVVLPEGFSPKNILIEAKPYGDEYTGTSEKIAWVTSG